MPSTACAKPDCRSEPTWSRVRITTLSNQLRAAAVVSDTRQAQIEVACRASIVDNLALAEASKFEALDELQARGAELHRWPLELLVALEAAWQEVAAEQAAQDADFKRAWDSLQAFRADYRIWKDLGYLD